MRDLSEQQLLLYLTKHSAGSTFEPYKMTQWQFQYSDPATQRTETLKNEWTKWECAASDRYFIVWLLFVFASLTQLKRARSLTHTFLYTLRIAIEPADVWREWKESCTSTLRSASINFTILRSESIQGHFSDSIQHTLHRRLMFISVLSLLFFAPLLLSLVYHDDYIDQKRQPLPLCVCLGVHSNVQFTQNIFTNKMKSTEFICM